MEFDDRVCEDRRKELEKARDYGKAFVALMGEGNLVAAAKALENARKHMDGEAHGFCAMCGEDHVAYEVCGGCFFKAHQKK